jgi:nicotinamide phosphoribosyltransferase
MSLTLNKKSLLYALDSYKQIHRDMYPADTEVVYSYLEARKGAMYDYTTFFGLQYILREWLDGVVVTKELIDEAAPVLREHFKFNGDVWSRAKWDHIVDAHGGRLPIKIQAVTEGKNYPIGTPLITVQNTGGAPTMWITNAMETVLQQVWEPITVCTRSNLIVGIIRDYFNQTVDENNHWLVDYYLHDFSMRGLSCMEETGIGCMAHLVNSKGTDSLMAIPYAVNYYGASIDGLAYSVPATEHSIQTSFGREREFEITRDLIHKFPSGILSVVSDSYDIENAVRVYCTDLKSIILNRTGKFVIRPDSPRFEGDTPQDQVLWIANQLWAGFGGTLNSKGYKVIDSHVGIIYGDSLTEVDIKNILETLKKNGFSAETCVFGCGSYLVRKLNRDTLRFAFKCSAQKRSGVWHDIYKSPRDASKASKRGRFDDTGDLETVFENGSIIKTYTFDEVRKNARL